MLSALIAFGFGIFEAICLKKLLTAATSGNYKHMAILLLLKFLSYGVAFALLIILFKEYIIYCAIGYSAGLPVATAAWFIYYTLHKKYADSGDGLNENNNNN